MKQALLFVDDEPNILRGLQRSTRSMKDDWDMEFVNSGLDGIKKLKERIFDIVISDLRMPEMNGAEFLEEVKHLQPSTIRIILSGHADLDMAARAAKSAHRFISKPCAPEEMKHTIKRALDLREKLSKPALHALAASAEPLPAMPKLYQKLIDELAKPDATMEDIGSIIAGDISMTSAVLKIVNSSFFGNASRVENVEKATIMLGAEVIKNLVLANEIFSTFNQKSKLWPRLETIWNDGMAASAIVPVIARKLSPLSCTVDQAMTAAILQNLGTIMFADKSEDKYFDILDSAGEDISQRKQLEVDAFEFNHCELGAYTLGLWGLSDAIIEAVLYANSEKIDMASEPQVCLMIANAMVDLIYHDKEVPDVISAFLESSSIDSQLIESLSRKVLEK